MGYPAEIDGFHRAQCGHMVESGEPCFLCHPHSVRCDYCRNWCDPIDADGDARTVNNRTHCDDPECMAKAQGEFKCAECDEIHAGKVQHYGIKDTAICCRCWEDLTGDACEHPLFVNEV